MNRPRRIGLLLSIAVWVQLWFTTQLRGYYVQVLSAVVTVGLAFAAIVMLYRSFDERAGQSNSGRS